MSIAQPTIARDDHWTPQPVAEELIHELSQQFVSACSWVTELSDRLREETGTRLIDWVDHFVVPDADLNERLQSAGFVSQTEDEETIWSHEHGIFPQVVLSDRGSRQMFLGVESVADFLFAHRLLDETEIEGNPLGGVRHARVCSDGNCEGWVIERHGDRSLRPAMIDPGDAQAVMCHAEALRLRRRHFSESREGFAHASRLIDHAIADLGTARTCDLFFQAEREYWQSRNSAARLQKSRQDRLGLGWANHDHHTYRSSRADFAQLIKVLEQLGFHCRERFYAGESAGWGAQVLEQPDCGVVIFADVDLAANEVLGDFAHEPLGTRDELGTVGLWCRLHGEAFLEAGMHHLECQFDFEAAQQQLRLAGVETMKPFTDLPYLRQAFTKGEMWSIAPARIEALQASGLISDEDADRFHRNGALGSHLEILQRNEGYKGFNQTGIDEIILKTDPRRNASV